MLKQNELLQDPETHNHLAVFTIKGEQVLFQMVHPDHNMTNLVIENDTAVGIIKGMRSRGWTSLLGAHHENSR